MQIDECDLDLLAKSLTGTLEAAEPDHGNPELRGFLH
jgi:hypothetical protein